jgi:hypothetical protein
LLPDDAFFDRTVFYMVLCRRNADDYSPCNASESSRQTCEFAKYFEHARAPPGRDIARGVLAGTPV